MSIEAGWWVLSGGTLLMGIGAFLRPRGARFRWEREWGLYHDATPAGKALGLAGFILVLIGVYLLT